MVKTSTPEMLPDPVKRESSYYAHTQYSSKKTQSCEGPTCNKETSTYDINQWTKILLLFLN